MSQNCLFKALWFRKNMNQEIFFAVYRMPKLYSKKGIGAVYSNSEPSFIAKGNISKEIPKIVYIRRNHRKMILAIILLTKPKRVFFLMSMFVMLFAAVSIVISAVPKSYSQNAESYCLDFRQD